MNSRALRATIALVLLSSLSSPVLSAQRKGKKERAPQGTPVLWRDPGNISSRNLFLGPGGAAMRPDLRRVTFVKEEKGGYSTKYRIKDARGRTWIAKVGNEAQSETAAVRLVWAAGYMTEINYLVPRMTIPSVGTFANVRLEARPDNYKRLDEWKWDDNPFTGTKELQGLIIMMAMLNNWDLKDSNNQILHVPRGSRGELQYIISDLGATFGKTGSLPLIWRFTRSRNNPEDYAESDFIEEVKNDRVFFKYGGKNRKLFDDINVAEARWLGALLSRLSDGQISEAFRAANYAPAERAMMTRAVRWRIESLKNLRPRGSVGRLN